MLGVDNLILLAVFLGGFALQIVLCFTVRRLWIRLLPGAVCLLAGAVCLGLAFVLDGWDAVGCVILAVLALLFLMLFGLAWGIWGICFTIKRRREMRTREGSNKTVYLFDFDGTLVDSMPTFVSVMLRILDEHGISYGDDIVKIITPLGYHGTADYYRSLGVETPKEELIARMNCYAEEEYVHTIPAKEGVVATLKRLRSQGACLNVLTASPHKMLDPCLKRLEIFDLFDNVWSCDDFNTTKADPEIYRRAAEKMGCGVADVIFVDDNVNAVRTAKSAGMIAYGIFDESSADCVDEMKAVSDCYLDVFSQL